MYGQRKLIRINLSNQKVSKEPIPSELYRKFLGGEGINAWLLWEHFLRVNPGIDPLSEDNVLIVGVGPLASTGLGAGSKAKFTYKSPAYNLYGDTSVGGRFSSQLRWAGYDHIVITGRAKQPVYIYVNDDSVEIREASHLWGKNVSTTDELIKKDLGDERVESAYIGQAGENLVRFASVIVNCHRAGGRGGAGCVFGSKNLKAIVACGTKGLSIHDSQRLLESSKEFREYREREPGKRIHLNYGTISTVRGAQLVGILAYRNHQGDLVPDYKVDKIDHKWYADNIGVRVEACSPGCVFACGGWYHIKGDESPGASRHAGEWGSKPEFGAINPFACGCDIPDLPEVCHLNKMCNEYGMDTMETGMVIAFLMELWERGIISQEDTAKWAGEPLSLEWGNYEAVERIIEAIALRKNKLGELLSGGVYKAALMIERMKELPVLEYAVYGKAGATHEAQVRHPIGAIYKAVASVGAHHTKGMGVSPAVAEKFLGTPDGGRGDAPLSPDAPKESVAPISTVRGAGQALSEYLLAISNSLGVCKFLTAQSAFSEIPLEVLSKALRAVSGMKLTPEDLVTAGKRVVNIQKAFNSRLGLRREDDTICQRWMNATILSGPAKGARVGDFIELLKDGYYDYHGWDKKTSLQTKQKLEELGMGDVAQVLAGEGALADVAGGGT